LNTFLEMIQLLFKIMTQSKAKDENQPTKELLRLRRVVTTVLAVRKFQKLGSHKFKQSIECQFDRKVAINQVKSFFEQDILFHLNESKQFVYYIRKFTITFDELKKIHINLFNEFLQQEEFR